MAHDPTATTTTSDGPAEGLQVALRRVLANRHGPEAAALFQTLLRYIDKRVALQIRTRCHGLLSDTDHEELVGEVLYQLMRGGLARFRGDTMPELIGFVRTATDRITWRAADKRLRERDAVAAVQAADDTPWTRDTVRAEAHAVEITAASPLSDDDQDYLRELLFAGSKAELARRREVSRAAVTQRIQRIRDRLNALPAPARAAHEAWLHALAAETLRGADPAPS
jgi:hypothetical protein